MEKTRRAVRNMEEQSKGERVRSESTQEQETAVVHRAINWTVVQQIEENLRVMEASEDARGSSNEQCHDPQEACGD